MTPQFSRADTRNNNFGGIAIHYAILTIVRRTIKT